MSTFRERIYVHLKHLSVSVNLKKTVAPYHLMNDYTPHIPAPSIHASKAITSLLKPLESYVEPEKRRKKKRKELGYLSSSSTLIAS